MTIALIILWVLAMLASIWVFTGMAFFFCLSGFLSSKRDWALTMYFIASLALLCTIIYFNPFTW